MRALPTPSAYRLKPRRELPYFIVTALSFALFTAIPFGVNALLPASAADTEELEIGDDTVTGEQCALDSMATLGKGYDCSGVSVQYAEYSDDEVDDTEETLRRMLKAAAYTRAEDSRAIERDDAMLVVAPEASAVAIASPSEDDEREYVVIQNLHGSGEDFSDIVAESWSALGGHEFPQPVRRALTAMGGDVSNA